MLRASIGVAAAERAATDRMSAKDMVMRWVVRRKEESSCAAARTSKQQQSGRPALTSLTGSRNDSDAPSAQEKPVEETAEGN